MRLEAHAWLLRASSAGHESAPTRSHDAATAMASYVSMSFREPLTVADVAGHVTVDLHAEHGRQRHLSARHRAITVEDFSRVVEARLPDATAG